MALGPEKRRLIRRRFRLRKSERPEEPVQDQLVETDAAELTGVFAVPSWLRDIGFAAVVAAVASPLVGWLHRRGLPGGPASAVPLLGIVALGVVIVVVIIAGITSQSEGLS
jgi:hypothetical protein